MEEARPWTTTCSIALKAEHAEAAVAVWARVRWLVT